MFTQLGGGGGGGGGKHTTDVKGNALVSVLDRNDLEELMAMVCVQLCMMYGVCAIVRTTVLEGGGLHHTALSRAAFKVMKACSPDFRLAAAQYATAHLSPPPPHTHTHTHTHLKPHNSTTTTPGRPGRP